MVYEITNGTLNAKIDSLGAELKSAVSYGTEYVWNGDKKWWDDTAPVLFPICCRLPEKKYSFGGRVYDMDIHGFAWKSEFLATRVEKSRLTLVLHSSDATRAQYPFDFVFTADYSVEGDTLSLKLTVENKGSETMPYMVGWHPGFSLHGDGEINSFSLKFNTEKNLLLHPILPGCFVKQEGEDYAVNDGTYVLNEEEIYTNDTVIFSTTGGTATLTSPCTDKKITMSYSDNLPFFCIWKEADSRARFICLEPWSDIPAPGDAPVAFESRPMSRLKPDCKAEYSYNVKLY